MARIFASILMPSITLVAQLFFRRALEQETFKLTIRGLFNLATNPYLLTGVAIQGTGFVLWLYILSQLKLAQAFGAVGAGFYVAVALVGYFVYDESLSSGQITGILMISGGLLFLLLG